jgi:hypothetical protein
LSETVEWVVLGLDELTDAVGVLIRDAGQGSDQQVVQGREVVEGQAGGDPRLLGDGAVGDTSGAVAADDRERCLDDLGPAALTA